jgi:hypothetical protein
MYIPGQMLKVLHEDRVNQLKQLADAQDSNEVIESGKRLLSNLNYLLSTENNLDGYTAPRKAHRSTQEMAAVTES